MKILGCDTSTEHAVFTVGNEAGGLLSCVTFAHGRDLSRRFFSGLTSALALSHTDFASIDVLAVGIGPGSFTGIRCAMSTMRTLSQACGKPLVGVGTLDVYADDAAKYLSNPARIIAVLPSRRNEVYAAVYAQDGRPIDDPFVATPEKVREIVNSSVLPVLLCGQTDCILAQSVSFSQLRPGPPPESLARMAALKTARQDFTVPSALLPAYVVAPVITAHKTATC